MLFFLHHGYRVIAHDRRGHGRSAQVVEGTDMNHYADDLAELTEYLDLHLPGFPHGMPTTHADVINAGLLAFIQS
jgi:pimeloyl-ACP methyl ester carboxylesterase